MQFWGDYGIRQKPAGAGALRMGLSPSPCGCYLVEIRETCTWQVLHNISLEDYSAIWAWIVSKKALCVHGPLTAGGNRVNVFKGWEGQASALPLGCRLDTTMCVVVLLCLQVACFVWPIELPWHCPGRAVRGERGRCGGYSFMRQK